MQLNWVALHGATNCRLVSNKIQVHQRLPRVLQLALLGFSIQILIISSSGRQVSSVCLEAERKQMQPIQQSDKGGTERNRHAREDYVRGTAAFSEIG